MSQTKKLKNADTQDEDFDIVDDIQINPEVSKSGEEQKFAKILFAILLVIAIFFIFESPYLETYSYSVPILVALLSLAIGNFIISHKIPLYYLVGLSVLFILSSWLLNQQNDDYSFWGSILLIFTIIVNMGYISYLKFYKKMELSNFSLLLTLGGGLLSVIGLCLAIY